ncbi:MAG: TonB-dependent receptor, partial [Muribaculaceae bacterium]|nr:TonB-dependent receptor [Muribaculaceae bacterium]
ASLTLHAGRYHQYLHQVGFSDLGMSSDFKIAASRRIPPQECLTLAAGAVYAPGGGVRLNADAYCKLISHQPEYLGAVLDILDAGYAAENYIRQTRGHNFGGSVSARWEHGPLNASLAYAYCLTRRRMEGEPGWFSAAGELRHTLRAAAAWNAGSHWTFSATFALASGRPYTPVTAIYFIGEQLMMEYGPRNSARLPAYHRLDLGAAYRFRTGGRVALRHEIGASVINAYGRANVELSTFVLDTEEGTYRRRDVSSLYRFLPSLNYIVSF